MRRRRPRGAERHAIGRSRGGRTTKIHAATDGCGRPVAIEITPGQRGDAPVASVLIAAVAPSRRLIADAAYDSDGLRRFLAERGTEPVIKPNPTRKRPAPYDRAAFRARNAIERMFSRLKDWRRVATRYDKLKETYSAAVHLAAIVQFWL